MRKALLLIVLVVGFSIAFGQPRIDNVQRVTANPFAEVLITGDGFSATPADLQVWFGSVKGTIVSSAVTSIHAIVPASARLSSVEVIHLPTRRSAKSADRFVPNFSGVTASFSTTNFTSTTFTNPIDVFDLCSCDFDVDGKPDIAGSKWREGSSNIMMLRNTSTVAANNTTMSFAATAVALAFPTYSVSCGDLNGDGKPELVASRGGTSTGSTIFVFQNTSPAAGTISFAAPIQLNLALGDFAQKIAINDLNRDGQPEIIVTNGQNNTIYIFENNLTTLAISAGDFTRIAKPVIGIPAGTGTLALEVADMTGDGWPEIIVAPDANATDVFILTNPANGTLTFTAPAAAIGDCTNINDVAVADFNNDGLLDFAVADFGGKAFVYLNLGGGLNFASVNGTTGFPAPVAFGVDVSDINGDGFVDFVISNRKFSTPAPPEEVSIFISNGAATPTFTKSIVSTSPRASWFVLTQDFDGDSKPDFAVTTTTGAAFGIDVWKNKNCHQAKIINESPLTLCNPQDTLLQAVPLQGVTYSWNHTGTGASAGSTRTVTIADAGTVTLTAVGEGGTCSNQATITIINGGGSQPPQPNITAPSGACAGNSIDVSSSTAAAAYEWFGPNGFTSTVIDPPAITDVTIDHAGVYKLRVKVGGCFSDFKEVQIDVVPFSPFSIVADASVCAGQSIDLEATSVQGTAGFNFQWKKNGSNVGTNNATFTISTAAESDEDNYTVFVSHPTYSCNNTSSPFALKVLDMPVATFTKSPASLICVGTEVAFDASTSDVDNDVATPDYNWNFGDSNTGTNSSASHTYSSQQTVTVVLTVSYTGVTGCSDASDNVSSPAATFDVNTATAPTLSITPTITEICGDGTETAVVDVIGTYTSYAWTPTAPDAASLTIDGPGTYAVETTDINGCKGNVEITIAPKAGCETGTIGIPKVFTPNNDNSNDLWMITGVPNIDACSMSVFDGRGRRVFEVKSFPVTGWDGVANGKPLPDGTYYYVLGCPGSKPRTGSILIVR